MINRKKASLLVTLALAVPVVLAGCGNGERVIVKDGTFRGFPARAVVDADGRSIALNNKGDENRESQLRSGIKGVDSDNDGRLDEILLYRILSGHPLEQYVNLDSLELAYKTIIGKK